MRTLAERGKHAVQLRWADCGRSVAGCITAPNATRALQAQERHAHWPARGGGRRREREAGGARVGVRGRCGGRAEAEGQRVAARARVAVQRQAQPHGARRVRRRRAAQHARAQHLGGHLRGRRETLEFSTMSRGRS